MVRARNRGRARRAGPRAGARRLRWALRLGLVLLCATPGLFALQFGLDQVSAGPLWVHDHVSFAFHQPALNDPFPHEFKQGYGFDGGDLGLAFRWHWSGFHARTWLRVSPASRTHWAYDQDTDLRPTTDATHGNEGYAKSRTFGIGQELPLAGVGRLGAAIFQFDFLRQWTRYHAVTTYDLNSNPALPSVVYSRLISERAIVYELRPAVALRQSFALGGWRIEQTGSLAPVEMISLHNYIPVVLAVSSTTGYGWGEDFAVTRGLGAATVRLSGVARWENGYGRAKFFRREEFGARIEIVFGRESSGG